MFEILNSLKINHDGSNELIKKKIYRNFHKI